MPEEHIWRKRICQLAFGPPETNRRFSRRSSRTIFLRQAAPQAGAGPERSGPFSVVYEESGDISDEYQNGLRWMNYDDGTYSGMRTFTEKHGNPVTRSNFSGTLPLNVWTRTAPDLISGVLGGRGLDQPAGFDYTFDNATQHYWGETRYRTEGAETGTNDSRETTTERINEIQSKHGRGLGTFGSGRDAGDTAVSCRRAAHQRGRIHLLQLFFEALRTSKHLNRKHGVNM